MKQVHFTLLTLETNDIFEELKFRCQETECTNLTLTSVELFEHARDFHNCGWVKIDSSVLG